MSYPKILSASGMLFERCGHDVTSQNGEDGFIEAVFNRIGTKNKWCFEVGASDGIFYSNTKVLRDAGWNAVLIEAREDKFCELAKLRTEKVATIRSKIGMESLDQILHDEGAPLDMDLGIIDIDGQDYWAWAGMTVYKPRVMMVEPVAGGGNPDFLVPLNGEGQSGINQIVALGEMKGYIPLLATHCNVLFCREDCWK